MEKQPSPQDDGCPPSKKRKVEGHEFVPIVEGDSFVPSDEGGEFVPSVVERTIPPTSSSRASATVVHWPKRWWNKSKPQVSSQGRFRNTVGGVYFPRSARGGYGRVQIARTTYRIHRLVARAFHGAPPTPQHCQVNHIDLDTTNNCVQNLEWCTRSENIRHAFATNTNRRSSVPKTSKPVESKRYESTDAWTQHQSINEAARSRGVNPGGVSCCCQRKIKQSGSFAFRFASVSASAPIEGEVWKPVVFGDDMGEVAPCAIQNGCIHPEVSSTGRFRSSRGVISVPSINQDGYCKVGVFGSTASVHTLQARAFFGPRPSAEHTVDHIDRVKSNNNIANLKWADRKEQLRNRKMPKNSRLTTRCLLRPVGTDEWVSYESMASAALALTLNAGSLSACASGLVSHTGGYECRYAEDNSPTTLEDEEWRDVVTDDDLQDNRLGCPVRVNTNKGAFLPFGEARAFVRHLGLRTQKEWCEWCRSALRPENIPRCPHTVYRKQWRGTGDWLGTEFLPFVEARSFVRKIGLLTRKEWREWRKSDARPATIPSNPNLVYRQQWLGSADWLGTPPSQPS